MTPSISEAGEGENTTECIQQAIPSEDRRCVVPLLWLPISARSAAYFRLTMPLAGKKMFPHLFYRIPRQRMPGWGLWRLVVRSLKPEMAKVNRVLSNDSSERNSRSPF